MRWQSCFVEGIPATKKNTGTDGQQLKEWKTTLQQELATFKSTNGACKMTATFHLSPDRFTGPHPFGPDLDNLLKPVLDEMETNAFAGVTGEDACVVHLRVTKKGPKRDGTTGVQIRLKPLRRR